MDDDLIADEQRLVEITRRKIATRIAMESEALINALFDIANDSDEDARVRLTAINMLLERSLPKLGVEHATKETEEESGSSRAMRAEIETLIKAQGVNATGLLNVNETGLL